MCETLIINIYQNRSFLCQSLSADDLGKVLKMLDSSCPNCLVKKTETNEVDVNVDLITGKAFREASAETNKILPDAVLASSSRRSAAAALATKAQAIGSTISTSSSTI